MDLLFWHPLGGLSNAALGWLLIFLGGGAVLCMLRIDNIGRRLKTATAPLGLVSLEMSLSVEESRQVISGWNQDKREAARQQLVCDYWLIPLFTTAMAILGLITADWFAAKQMPWMSAMAMALAWTQWLVGLFDFTENSALLRMLQTYPAIPTGTSRLVAFCARAKFLVIMLALFLTLFIAVTWLM